MVYLEIYNFKTKQKLAHIKLPFYEFRIKKFIYLKENNTLLIFCNVITL